MTSFSPLLRIALLVARDQLHNSKFETYSRTDAVQQTTWRWHNMLTMVMVLLILMMIVMLMKWSVICFRSDLAKSPAVAFHCLPVKSPPSCFLISKYLHAYTYKYLDSPIKRSHPNRVLSCWVVVNYNYIFANDFLTWWRWCTKTAAKGKRWGNSSPIFSESF